MSIILRAALLAASAFLMIISGSYLDNYLSHPIYVSVDINKILDAWHVFTVIYVSTVFSLLIPSALILEEVSASNDTSKHEYTNGFMCSSRDLI